MFSIAVKYPKQDPLPQADAPAATEPESDSPVSGSSAESPHAPIQLDITLNPRFGIDPAAVSSATIQNADVTKRLVKMMIGVCLVGFFTSGVVYRISWTALNLAMFALAAKPITMIGSVRSRRRLLAAKVAAPLLFGMLLEQNLLSGAWAADDLVSACLNSAALISTILTAAYAPFVIGYHALPMLNFERFKFLSSLRKFIR